jgi:prepilin-type N-terminal cleavage/methylation domain-containing protein
VTLIEMMTVVAIVGVLSGLAGTALDRVVVQGRVNGAAGTTARVMANAHMRAAAMRCRISAQLNGPRYNPSGAPAGAPVQPNQLAVFMKGDCSSLQGAFEAGDHVLATFSLSDSRAQAGLPTTLFSAGALDTGAVVVSWGTGATGTFDRDIYIDHGAGSFTIVSGVGTLGVSFSAQNGATVQRSTLVPVTGAPYLD